MRIVNVSAVQFAPCGDISENIKKAEQMIEASAAAGANIILLPELFASPYFCQFENYDNLSLAEPLEASRIVNHFKEVAKRLNVVLPISFFEEGVNTAFNSIAIIDADGAVLGVYRKTHIPDGHFYEEKFYFTPGDTGFKTWATKFGKIGVGICWDQWFCESARIMALQGAEILFYPTAIGNEPVLNTSSKTAWRHAMQGHCAVNIMPLVCSNRIGVQELQKGQAMRFFGSSFIAGHEGQICAQMNEEDEGFIINAFDLDEIKIYRRRWGAFRDRRPEMYKELLTYGKAVE